MLGMDCVKGLIVFFAAWDKVFKQIGKLVSAIFRLVFHQVLFSCRALLSTFMAVHLQVIMLLEDFGIFENANQSDSIPISVSRYSWQISVFLSSG